MTSAIDFAETKRYLAALKPTKGTDFSDADWPSNQDDPQVWKTHLW